MLTTEQDAKEKWCPMVRIARREQYEQFGNIQQVVVAGCNTDALGRTRVPGSCRCIGSDCMMWRWTEPLRRRCVNAENPNAMVFEEAGDPPPGREHWTFCECDNDPASWVEPEEEARARRLGYCGLAVKSEIMG